jgi:site-specific recombinase XerD
VFALTKLEVRQVLAAVDLTSPFGQRDYLLVLFLYHTGLRVGECAGLVTNLVALDGVPRQYLHLPATICKGSRGRVVPLNAVAQQCVRKLLAFNSARGFSTAPAAPLFQNRCHGPLSVRSIQHLVADYREKAGLDVRATPHTFRHTHASHLVAAGVPTPHVQKVLGHRHLSSTQVYTHVNKEQLLESSRVLE